MRTNWVRVVHNINRINHNNNITCLNNNSNNKKRHFELPLEKNEIYSKYIVSIIIIVIIIIIIIIIVIVIINIKVAQLELG